MNSLSVPNQNNTLTLLREKCIVLSPRNIRMYLHYQSHNENKYLIKIFIFKANNGNYCDIIDKLKL